MVGGATVGVGSGSPDSELPDELGSAPSPGDDGETVAGVDPETVVFAPPDAETVPDDAEVDGVPPEGGVPPAGSESPDEPPDADVTVDDPVFDESVCVVESEVESLEPVVSAKATRGVEAIIAPTPKATASAPTLPT